MKYKTGKDENKEFFILHQNFLIKVHLKALIKKYIAEIFSDIFYFNSFYPS